MGFQGLFRVRLCVGSAIGKVVVLYFFSSSPVNALALQKHKFSGEKSPWNPMCRYFWSPLYTIMIIQRSVKLTVPVSVYFVWKHVPPLSWPTVQSTPKVTVH